MIKFSLKLGRRLFDKERVHGVIISFSFGSVCCLYMWHAQDVVVWFDTVVLGRDYNAQLLTEGELRSRRALAVGLFVSLVLSHGVYMFFLIREKLRRRRAKKSAQGQWYDTDSLTKEDLYADKDVDDEPK